MGARPSPDWVASGGGGATAVLAQLTVCRVADTAPLPCVQCSRWRGDSSKNPPRALARTPAGSPATRRIGEGAAVADVQCGREGQRYLGAAVAATDMNGAEIH